MNAELTFLQFLQSLHSPMLDGSMGFITRLGDSGILWVTLTALLLVFRKTRRVGCVLAAALLIDAVLCNLLLKPLVARIRPCDILMPQTIKEGEEGLVSTIGDEGLYGQACQVRTAPGGVTAAGVRLPPDVAEVVSFYGYHGYVDQRELQFVREEELWEYLGADLVLVALCI